MTGPSELGNTPALDDADPAAPEPSRTTLSQDLETTLAALHLGPTDAALAGLLRLYASELDGARAAERRAAQVARDVIRELGAESALHERVQALQMALARRTALDRIGARLQSALTDMLATRRARAGRGDAEPEDDTEDDADTGATVTPLGRLRLASGADGTGDP